MVCFSRRSWRVSIRRSRDSSIQRANLRASIRVTISSIGASRIRQHLRHMRPQIWKTGERSTPQMIRISYIPLFSTFRQASPFLFRGRILRFLSNYRESYPMVLYHVSTASVQSFHSFVNCWPLIHNIRVFRVNNDMLTEESIFAEKLQKLTRTCYSEAQDPPTNALFWRLVLAGSLGRASLLRNRCEAPAALRRQHRGVRRRDLPFQNDMPDERQKRSRIWTWYGR